MARVKKVKKKETEKGIEHREVWVDTKTGKEYSSPEAVKTQEEFGEMRKLPEPQKKEAFIGAAREREGLPIATSEERLKAFREETGADILQEGLKQKIAEPPSLEPETQPFQKEVTELGLTPATAVGNLLTGLVEKVTGKTYGRTTPEELAKTDVGKFLGTATAATGIALAGALAAPYVVALVAKSAITKSVLGAGGSVPFLKTAIAGTTTFLVGRSILDIRGDEMDVLRQGLKKVVEDGERIEAAMRNGYPSEDTISLLTTMAEEVEYAEIRIKELGNNNIQYRVSKEYILDMQNVRSSREALLRRVLAVENIAATGQAAFNPEALMFNVAQFEKGGGE